MYSVGQRGAMLDNVMQYYIDPCSVGSVVKCYPVQCCAVVCSAVQCWTVLYNVVQCCTVLYSVAECCRVLYSVTQFGIVQ